MIMKKTLHLQNMLHWISLSWIPPEGWDLIKSAMFDAGCYIHFFHICNTFRSVSVMWFKKTQGDKKQAANFVFSKEPMLHCMITVCIFI